ncbi:MAG: hypothetical protein ACT4P7_17395, partial [Gemmatimonadaceae bacterium]
MNDHSPMHLPTPEFRASLEREIVRTLQRETRFVSPRRPHRFDRMKAVGLLAAGLLLGVGVQLASAQVADARQRSELERAAETELAVAALRLDLAREAHDRARRRVEVGTLPRQSELDAAAEVRMREMEVARINFDLLEIRASAAA